MANYNTNLTTWGSTGQAYPSGYAYAEDEQPVDAWDNYFNYNVYTDLSHLISLTNSRIESDSGQNAPGSPETAHLFYNTDTETLVHWDSTQGVWRELTRTDEIDSDGDGTVDDSDAYAGTEPSDGTDGQVLRTDGTTTTWDTISTRGYDINAEDTGAATSGDLSIFQVFGLDDGDTVYVERGSLIESNTFGAVPDGCDLVLASYTETKRTLLDGDGTTVYDGEDLSISYTNTTGSRETLVFAVDNGQYNTGSGDYVDIATSTSANIN